MSGSLCYVHFIITMLNRDSDEIGGLIYHASFIATFARAICNFPIESFYLLQFCEEKKKGARCFVLSKRTVQIFNLSS